MTPRLIPVTATLIETMKPRSEPCPMADHVSNAAVQRQGDWPQTCASAVLASASVVAARPESPYAAGRQARDDGEVGRPDLEIPRPAPRLGLAHPKRMTPLPHACRAGHLGRGC